VNALYAATAGLVWLIISIIGGVLFGFAVHDGQRELENEQQWKDHRRHEP